jgi:uncharacterized protein
VHGVDAPLPRPASAAKAPNLIYNLRVGESSDLFYADAARLSDELLAEAELRAAGVLDGYARQVQRELQEPERSRGEYILELLTLGMAIARYSSAAQCTSAWAMQIAQKLFRLRHRSPWVKKPADWARSALVRIFFMPKIGLPSCAANCSLDSLPRLIAWLRASGEFEQEASRLDNWLRFLRTRPAIEATRWIEASIEFFAWFEHEAACTLGRYTHGVEPFLAHDYARRGCREDQLFCGKPAVAYHLGMVAAEIMNRGLREEFESKARKVLLVPACMRGAKARHCRARVSGTDMTCTACDPECAVNRITRTMRKLGAMVYVVPHSTGFSRWLERWQHAPDTGVAAVACMLNILPGGFEMRARGIASQCVPLDYPGCAKHWRRPALATGLNEQRLVQIVVGPQ